MTSEQAERHIRDAIDKVCDKLPLDDYATVLAKIAEYIEVCQDAIKEDFARREAHK